MAKFEKIVQKVSMVIISILALLGVYSFPRIGFGLLGLMVVLIMVEHVCKTSSKAAE